MGTFSNSKNHGDFTLKPSDFKTESTSATVTATWISPEFLKRLPKPPTTSPKKTTVTSKTSKAVIQLFGVDVNVTFDPEEINRDLHDYVPGINNQLNWILSNKSLIEEAIVQNLLASKNSHWLERNESQLSSKEFLTRIKLESIEFFDDISFELSYDGGNIFAGHDIVVQITSNGKIEKVTVEG
jgi:hypothetical protein